MKKFDIKASDALGNFKLKTTDFMKNIDCKMNIGRMEEEMEELYLDIGEIVCRYLDSGEEINLVGPVRQKYNRITMLKKDILNQQKRIYVNNKGVKYCERCNEVFEEDSIYCSVCGNRLR